MFMRESRTVDNDEEHGFTLIALVIISCLDQDLELTSI